MNRAAVDQTSVDQFLCEIRSTASLRHPHIVPVLEVGSSEGIFYFVMEYCAGRNLDPLMAAHGGRLSLELAGPIILQTLEGLAFAHEQGIVHRNLKPRVVRPQLQARRPHVDLHPAPPAPASTPAPTPSASPHRRAIEWFARSLVTKLQFGNERKNPVSASAGRLQFRAGSDSTISRNEQKAGLIL